MSQSVENGKTSGRLTTHVLDTANGIPASGMAINLYRVAGEIKELLESVKTNADGRCDDPLLQGVGLASGEYELEFDVGGYFSSKTEIPFLGKVPVRFGISAVDQHYHVPLLVSPFGYSTYRGS